MSGDVRALDAKIAEICWVQGQNISLQAASQILHDWMRDNGWESMTYADAERYLIEESRTKRLKPVASTPRQDALDVIGVVIDTDSEQALGVATANAVLDALQAQGLMITRIGRP